MSGYDYIYGSKVTIQCQAQINVEPWKGQEDYVSYLYVIKKDKNFFKCWYKVRNAITCVVEKPSDEEFGDDVLEHVGTHKNDYLVERHRAIGWSTKEGKLSNVSKSGHGKQLFYIPHETFCARDQGINFKLSLPNYSASGQIVIL